MKFFLYIVVFSSMVACTNMKKGDIESNIGLYEIVSAECDVGDTSFDPCATTYFFELLKGQFKGVKSDDLAYVFWSGYPEIDSELQYTSHIMENYKTKRITDGKIWLNNNKEVYEYLVFRSGVLSEYYVEYNENGTLRKIRYTLNPVRRGSKPKFRMNYPDNK